MQTQQSVKDLVIEAKQQINNLTIEDFKEQIKLPNTIIIDIRDVRELYKAGKIPNAIHMPRGMLEFWFDATSPYYRKDVLTDAEHAILYCAADWRSSLATLMLQQMGVQKVSHLSDGFNGWVTANETIESVPQS